MSDIFIHRPHPTRESDGDWDTINSTQLYRLYPHPRRVAVQIDSTAEKAGFASEMKVITPSPRKASGGAVPDDQA